MNTNNPNHIPFKIDNQEFKLDPSENPVSGQYLRDLASVGEDYDLWLRARGNEDDTLIEAGGSYTIEPGFHFYTSKREITPGEL